MTKPCAILILALQFFLVACRAQVTGCTDPLASNYDPLATINDGSCAYDPISVSPQTTFSLSDQIQETSGLILWDGNLWTHNDNTNTVIYGLDTLTADIERYYDLHNVENSEWEEISQDQEYIYLGGFGNNANGNRNDLHILRIEKGSLLALDPVIDTIWFSYSDQTDFSPKEPNQTDFDCEAMIVSDDSIYLFTKQWISTQTTLYALPKVPGNHIANKKASYNIQGLITGATYFESKRLVVLCGYTSLLHPFLFLLYDFQSLDFFSGNKRRITISLPFHQIEGITTQDGLKYYISNESFVLQPFTNSPQKLHIFNLSTFLLGYLSRDSLNVSINRLNGTVLIYPNPASNKISIKIDREIRPAIFEIYDQSGRIVSEGILSDEISTVDISHLAPGVFTFMIVEHQDKIFSILKYQ